MSFDARIAMIRDACRQIWGAYAVAIDRADAAALAKQFAPDGVLVRGETLLVGHNEIPQILDGRARDMVMRHLVTTADIRVATDLTTAEGIAYYVLYTGRGTDVPLPLGAPFSLGEWHSRFKATPEGWRLLRHEVHRLFVRAPT